MATEPYIGLNLEPNSALYYCKLGLKDRS